MRVVTKIDAPIRVLRALEKANATVSSKSASQMRLRLCIDPNAADLHAYPWERLFMQWQGSAIPLAASSLILFSRFIPLEEEYTARMWAGQL